MSAFIPLFYKISPNKIVTVKQVLESYDGLGLLRTLDPKEGFVVILTVSDMSAHVKEVMSELEAEEMPAPDSAEYERLVGIKRWL